MASLPTVVTNAASVTGSDATLNGDLTSDGGGTITERGFYYETTVGTVTTIEKVVEGGTATGAFSDTVEGLAPGTYRFEAFATNEEGESRGSELSFVILENNVVITTDTAELFSHDVYFEFVIGDTTTATYDTLLLDMGKLKYTFDIPNDGEDTTAVGLKAGAVDVTLDNFITDSSELFISLLDSSFTHDSTQQWKAKMYWRLRGGSYGNPVLFDFSQREVEIDEVSQRVKLSLLPVQESLYTGVELGELADSEVYSYDLDAGTNDLSIPISYTAMLAKDYITHFLFQTYIDNPTYPISDTPVVRSSIFVDNGYSGIVTGDQWFVYYEAFIDGEQAPVETPSDAEIVVGAIASLEGAIYGTSLGKPFYVNRADTNNKITLDTDNIVKIKQTFFNRAEYRRLNITHIPYNVNADELLATAVSRNPYAEKDINIRLEAPLVYYGTVTSSGQADQIPEDNTIILEGISSYKPAFSFDNEKKVSVTYWGIDGIFPYSVINFDANAPDFVKNRDFRVKEIEYDFKGDKVMMEIYEI